MKRTEKRNNIAETFDSVSEFLADIKTREYCMEYGGYNRGNGRPYRNWNGATTYDDAVSKMINGVDENISAMNINIPRATTTAPTFKTAVVGFAPIVPRAIMGLPDNMRTRADAPTRYPVITLNIDVAQHAGHDANDFIEYGKKCVSLIKGLEQTGARVKVYVMEALGWENKRAILRILLKDADRVLDIKRLCYPLLEPSMLRVITFDWYEHTKLPVSHDDGYGVEIGRNAVKDIDFIKSLDRDAYYINARTDFEQLKKEITGARV